MEIFLFKSFALIGAKFVRSQAGQTVKRDSLTRWKENFPFNFSILLACKSNVVFTKLKYDHDGML